MSEIDISPARAVDCLARYEPDIRSLDYEGRTWTVREVADSAARLATVLSGLGVRRGDRVAYLGLNSPTFLLLYLACSRLGAVFVPVNFRLAANEVRVVLADAAPRVVVAEDGHRAVADEVAPGLTVHGWLLVDDDPAIPVRGDKPHPRWASLSPLVAAAEPRADAVALGNSDIALLMFTSGTTGRPKGVILTHGNVWWNAVNVDSVVRTRKDDATLAAAPMFHIGGLNALTLRTLVRGGTVLVRRSFDPVQFLDDLVRHHVTTAFGVPAMFNALMRAPGFAQADLSALESAIVAGAPVPPSLIADYAEHGIMLQQAWGLTETAPFATYLPAQMTRTKLGSAGIPMPFTEVRLVDPAAGRTITAPRTRGELVVRGPNVTPGYWNNPEATRTAFDDAGWFHTGDVGEYDEDGYVYIVDRIKDMIITGGENVYPAEVESALADMPGVIEAAVLGAPDPKWGETVVAVLACEAGVAPTLEDVRAHAGAKLARYKLPTRILVQDALPRNAAGKLDKIRLRDVTGQRQTEMHGQ
jgi:acyl-CoA synthetase (AMP-forming)/AMP-acid ligase II